MPFALNFYHDQIAADGAASALAAERRLLYVRHGRVTLNGEALKAGESRFCDGALEMRSAGEWSQIWRWDLAPPNAGAALLTGSGVLSSLRMSRIVSTLAVNPGTRWVFRLDEINTPAGRVADRHQHPGPGIRCLLEGTFNVQQAAESARDLMPGDVGDGLRHGDRLGLAPDGVALSARHGFADRMGGKGDGHLAFGRSHRRNRARQLEALSRSDHRGVNLRRVRALITVPRAGR